MGTSQSKPGTPGGSPLLAPWADKDPPPPDQAQPAPLQPPPVLPPSPFMGVKRALRDYMGSGDIADGRRALGSFSRAVGGRNGGARYARAARTAAGPLAALAAIASAGGNPVVVDDFDLGTLSGVPLEDAIATIVDRFCPPGILDEDVIRAAIADALFEALGTDTLFDPAAVTDRVVVVATACFVAELVFANMAAEQGSSASDVAPDVAIRRENALRDLVREVADQIATPILQQAGGALDAARFSDLISQITAAVQGEMSQW